MIHTEYTSIVVVIARAYLSGIIFGAIAALVRFLIMHTSDRKGA